jgi:hypothetical protein
MLIARTGRILTSMVIVALAAACASTPASDTAETTPSPSTQVAEGVIPITINHNKMDQGELTVYIQPTGGIRSVLGMIATNEIKTFQYRVVGSRNIQLAVQGTTGGGQTSRAITVPEGQGLNWDLSLNTIRLLRR